MDYIKKVSKHYTKKPLALINTFGCQQNENDSDKIAGLLSEMGYGFTDSANDADLVVFNTCAIRENAEKKVFGMLGALKPVKEIRPSLVIALCGCMANEEHVKKRIKSTFKQVDIVFGTNSIHRFPEYLYNTLCTKMRLLEFEEDMLIHEGLPTHYSSKIKAGVPIMYGCNNFCAYCIVPYVRGRERSRGESDIIKEVQALYEKGFQEVILLGQNVNSYGGGGDNFAGLLEKVSDTKIPRIRFMTSHPKDISDSVLRVMAERENICKSLHLPLQAGSDKILLAMNRKYTREKYLSIVSKARELMPDIVITTDIIVGFPGETNEDFDKTLEVIKTVRYDMIYSFIFSKRKGTPAEKMEDVLSEQEKKANFDRLIEVQNEISLEKNQKLLNRVVSVLAEGKSKTRPDILTGRTEGGKIVNFKAENSVIGKIVDVKITDVGTFNMSGVHIKDCFQ